MSKVELQSEIDAICNLIADTYREEDEDARDARVALTSVLHKRLAQKSKESRSSLFKTADRRCLLLN